MIWIGLIGEPSNQLSIIFDVSNNPLTILISVLGVFVSSLFLSKIFSDKGFATDFMFNALTISREKYYINIADPWLTSFELWNYLCKKINIRDSVLREFTGLFLFPWCKDLPYDYFIPDLSEKQKVRDEIEAYIKTRRNRISLK